MRGPWPCHSRDRGCSAPRHLFLSSGRLADTSLHGFHLRSYLKHLWAYCRVEDQWRGFVFTDFFPLEAFSDIFHRENGKLFQRARESVSEERRAVVGSRKSHSWPSPCSAELRCRRGYSGGLRDADRPRLSGRVLASTQSGKASESHAIP